MPLLVHAVRRALGLHRQAVQLARQTHGEVADIDHLLHLAVPFGADLAHLQRDQVAQRLLVFAQRIAQVADHLAALGGWHAAPGQESLMRR